MNSECDQLPVGMIAQLEEHYTGIAKVAEVMGSNPIQAWIFLRLKFHNCSSCVYNCKNKLNHTFLHNSNVWSFIYSFALFTFYLYIMNSECDQLPVGLIAHLEKHYRFESCSGLNFLFHNW